MVNTDDFIKRLELILEFYNLSASAFADKIGVQRSGLSHLLSGRNKPSLDFVVKVIDHFPDVDLYWLLNGKGTFPSSNDASPKTSVQPVNEVSIPPTERSETPPPPIPKSSLPTIQKIVVFYSDGTFAEYKSQ